MSLNNLPDSPMPARCIPPPPEPGTYKHRFAAELHATEQITYLGHYLAHVHWLLEGWHGLPAKLTGQVKRLYEGAAATAVRECCEVDRIVAMHRAEQHGIDIFPELERKLASCDTTPEKRRELISQFVQRVVTVRQAHMRDGCVRTPAEILEFDRQEMEAEDGEA